MEISWFANFFLTNDLSYILLLVRYSLLNSIGYDTAGDLHYKDILMYSYIIIYNRSPFLVQRFEMQMQYL